MPPIERSLVGLDSPTGRRNPVGFFPCQGLYVAPQGSKPRTALIATHYNVDFSEHYLGSYMAERGYGFLGWNTRYRGAEHFFLLEHALVDIGVGVRWLREQAGIENVVLLGNSGGGSLMGAYQSQACASTLQGQPGQPLPDAVHDLPEADLYIALNAHPGRPEVLTAWMDASVIDETDPASVDPSLDMYNQDHGPPYSEEFIKRYRAGQEARNHRITAWVESELARLAERDITERVFTMQRTWADLRFLDAAIDPSERPGGRCYAGDPRGANFGVFGIGLCNTLHTWLSMWSLERSDCRGAPHFRKIALPSLVIQSLADTGVFPSDARAIHAELGASDKHLELIKGDHYLTEPASARGDVADLIRDWLHARGV